MDSSRTAQLRAIIALLCLSLIWGYNWVVMKETLHYVAPLQFGAIRTFFGSLLLFVVLILLGKSLRLRHTHQVIVIGLLQTGSFTALTAYALLYGGAGKVAVLTYSMPFWVMLLAWPLLGERLRGLQWLAGAASVGGLFFIIEPWRMHDALLSNLLAVSGGVCWAMAVILAKRLHQAEPDADLLAFTAWQMLIGSLPLVLLSFLMAAPPVHWSNYFIGATLYNVFACNALAWLLWLYALQHLQAGVASMLSLMTPVVGVLAAWMQLGEVPSSSELFGMLLIGLSIAMLALRGMRRHEAVEPAMAQE